MWNELKQKKLGYDFHRQKPIDEYIVDFYCEDLDLVIEIDGATHNERLDEDAKRQKNIENFGLTVLRYLDTDVVQKLGDVVEHLKLWIKEHTPSG